MKPSNVEQLIRHLEEDPGVQSEKPSTFPGCLSLAEVVDAAHEGWKPGSEAHVTACPYCQRALTNYLRMHCPEPWRAIVWMLRRDAWASALTRHIQDDECSTCALAIQSSQKLHVRDELESRIAGALAVFGSHLTLAPAGASFASEEEVGSRSRCLAEISNGDVTVRLDTMTGKLFLSVEVTPADERISQVDVLIVTEYGQPEWHQIRLDRGPGLAHGTKPLGPSRTWLAKAGATTVIVFT